MSVRTKRIYESSAKSDGYRVLVDRAWPRGMKKEDARLDAWHKEIAPTKELRKWFGHDPKKWEQFKSSYAKELEAAQTQALKDLAERAEKQNVTLLYAARDTEHNNAVALRAYLTGDLKA